MPDSKIIIFDLKKLKITFEILLVHIDHTFTPKKIVYETQDPYPKSNN